MSVRMVILAVGTASGLFLVGHTDQAEAGRLHLNVYPPFIHFYEPRGYAPPPPDYYYDDPYPYDEAYGGDDYYDDDYDTAPRIYQEPPLKRRYQPPKSAYQDYNYQPPKSVYENPYQPPRKKKTTANVPAKQASVALTAKPSTKATGKVSCDKAKTIIGGYGFSDVQSKGCDGSVYSFSARRDGKNFDIKVSSLSGELTEVKRQ